jgi:menaquinone-dependent protoporphyrinogen oxidase
MQMNILVSYASKYGATAEIAEKIGEVLRGAGLSIEILPAKQVKDLSPYNAVVLGSAVYYGRWRKPAVKFLKKNQKWLAERPVWLFSSGPVGEGDPVELLQGWTFPPLQQKIADRINPRDIIVFHGAVIQEKLNSFENSILEKLESPTGDFRNWDAITAWAQAIADELKSP